MEDIKDIVAPCIMLDMQDMHVQHRRQVFFSTVCTNIICTFFECCIKDAVPEWLWALTVERKDTSSNLPSTQAEFVDNRFFQAFKIFSVKYLKCI